MNESPRKSEPRRHRQQRRPELYELLRARRARDVRRYARQLTLPRCCQTRIKRASKKIFEVLDSRLFYLYLYVTREVLTVSMSLCTLIPYHMVPYLTILIAIYRIT